MNEIKELLKNDNIDKALAKLLLFCTKDEGSLSYEKELILLTARFENLSSKTRNGTINNSEENIERNQIRKSLLDILSNISNVNNGSKSPQDHFKIINNCRSEITEINASITAFKEETVERERKENNQIHSLLDKPKSKIHFDKIHKIFKISSTRIRVENKKIKEDIDDFGMAVKKLNNSYMSLISMTSELDIEENTQLNKLIYSFVELKGGYINILSVVQKGIKLRKNQARDSKFAAYSRAVKKGIEIEKEYAKYLELILKIIEKIKNNSSQ